MAARVSQETVEVLRQPSAQRVRVSEVTAEALTQPPDTQRARLSRLVVEALYASDSPPPAGGAATQRWTGSAWTAATTQRWTGSAWVAATVKRWDGTGWV